MRRAFFRLLICIVAFLICACAGTAIGRFVLNKQPPALYDMSRLDELKKKGVYDTEVSRFLKQADKMAAKEPVSIMDRNITFAPDPHYFCSISRYSWPSENDPNIYVIRDGMSNPELKDYNRPNIEELATRLKSFSVAYYITHDEKYYDAFCKQLESWFLDDKTYMLPSMEYAQVLPGKNENRSAANGLLELNHFTPAIESIYLLQYVRELNPKTAERIQIWFSDMLKWTLNDKRWESIKKSPNNIVSSVYVTLLEMARFTNNDRIADSLSREFTEMVINSQIDEEGKQPAELRRVAGFGYSVGNLCHVIDCCLIMEQAGIHYYKENQKKIDSAFEFLLQFVGNQEAFPYSQKSNWEGYEQKLERNVSRIRRLSSNNSRVERLSKSIILEHESISNYIY